MGHQMTRAQADELFARWTERYDVFAPVLGKGEGCFSDTDVVRYGKVTGLDQIVWDKKSD